MKKIFIIIGLISAAIAGAQNIDTQIQNLKSNLQPNPELIMKANNDSDTIWIYKIMEYYNWEGEEYVPFLYEIMEYNHEVFQDKPTKGTSVDPATGDSTSHAFYYYDSIGNKIEYFYQEYDFQNNIWKNKMNIFFSYDSFGYDTCEVSQIWSEDSNIWINDQRFMRQYDTNRYKTLKVFEKWENDKWNRFYGKKYRFDDKECMDTAFWYEWVPDVVGHWQKYLIKIWYYNECGVINEYLYKKWHESNQSWTNYQKFTDIEHINWTGCHNYNYSFSEDEDPEFTTFTFYHWMGDYWEPIKRTVNATADSLGGFHYETQEWNDNQWKDIFIVDRVVNEDGFIIFNKVQVNQDFQGIWKIIFADTVVLAYDGPRLTEYEVMWLDTTNGIEKWMPFQKYLYKDYFYILNTPEIETDGKSSGLQIIPNPAKNSILIRLNDEADRIKTVRVYNVTGQRMFERKFHGKRQQENLNISSLKNGVYIINVTTRQGKMMKGKFVKN